MLWNHVVSVALTITLALNIFIFMSYKPKFLAPKVSIEEIIDADRTEMAVQRAYRNISLTRGEVHN